MVFHRNQTSFVTDRNALGKKKSLFSKGFRARKRAILKVDDKYIIPVKNWILTGNKTAGTLKKSLEHFITLKRERILI